VPFFNDSINPPIFWGNGDTTMTMYSNTLPQTINNIVYVNATTQQVQLATPLTVVPYVAGDSIVISGTGSSYYDGTYTVVSATTSTINYTATPGAAFPDNGGQIAPLYSWNYNPNWKSVSAGWLRMYSTPNVGSILVAGNLTAVQFTQFSANVVTGNSMVFTPSAVSSMVGSTVLANVVPANTTILSVNPGVSFTMSTTANATVVNDSIEVDTVVNYPVTVQWSQAFGLNQGPTTWTPTITNVANQLEVPLRGVCVDAFPSNGQFFLCSYWDTVVFSPINYSTTSAPILGVSLFSKGRGMLSSNCWAIADTKVYGLDARDIWVFDGTSFTGIGNQRVKNWFFEQMNPVYADRTFMETNTEKNQIEIYYTDYNSPNGVPNKMLSYRYDLDAWNAPRDVSSATFATESPIYTSNVAALSSRTVVYAQGLTNNQIVQKDQGYSWANGAPISSTFRRDNIKLLPNYNEHIYVHRILPEAINVDSHGVPFYPAVGSLNVTIEGAESVGSSPTYVAPVTVQLNTTNPWAQIDQNENRVSSIQLDNTSSTNIWMCSAVTWQVRKVEDDH
jgi:hypothetical protein